MSRYIDADKFKKYILDRYNTMEMVGINQVVNFITEQPTADVKEVVRGEWGVKNDEQLGLQWFNCSICGRFEFNNSDFCPHCGSSMV